VSNLRLAQRQDDTTEINEFDPSETIPPAETSFDKSSSSTSGDDERPEMNSDDEDKSPDELELLST